MTFDLSTAWIWDETTIKEMKCRLEGLIQGTEEKYMINHGEIVAFLKNTAVSHFRAQK